MSKVAELVADKVSCPTCGAPMSAALVSNGDRVCPCTRFQDSRTKVIAFDEGPDWSNVT